MLVKNQPRAASCTPCPWTSAPPLQEQEHKAGVVKATYQPHLVESSRNDSKQEPGSFHDLILTLNLDIIALGSEEQNMGSVQKIRLRRGPEGSLPAGHGPQECARSARYPGLLPSPSRLRGRTPQNGGGRKKSTTMATATPPTEAGKSATKMAREVSTTPWSRKKEGGIACARQRSRPLGPVRPGAAGVPADTGKRASEAAAKID